MSDVRLPQHGRDHRVGGSDPIPGLGGGGGGGGIQFDTSPQSGLWLYVETTDASGAPNGDGIELYDSDASSGHTGILIHSDNNEVSITTGSQLAFDGSSWLVQMGPVTFDFTGRWSGSFDDDLDWAIDGDVKWTFGHTAESFTIYNPSNQPVFKVTANGTNFQIKTGGAWVANL